MPAMLMPSEKGKPIVLDKPIVLVGRHPDCDAVILNSRKISRKHCALALVNNKFVVRDLGSMNGIWVNGERVENQAAVEFGDELMIGDVVFTLQSDKDKNGSAKPRSSAPVVTASKSPKGTEPVARKQALVRPPNADLSMEFPVPIDDEDDSVPSPSPRKPIGMDTDGGDDDFIPLKDAD